MHKLRLLDRRWPLLLETFSPAPAAHGMDDEQLKPITLHRGARVSAEVQTVPTIHCSASVESSSISVQRGTRELPHGGPSSSLREISDGHLMGSHTVR